jgi:hypothetical protein
MAENPTWVRLRVMLNQIAAKKLVEIAALPRGSDHAGVVVNCNLGSSFSVLSFYSLNEIAEQQLFGRRTAHLHLVPRLEPDESHNLQVDE